VTDRRPSDPDDSGPMARTLATSLTAAPDDSDHPEHELLVLHVDGRLDDADREWIEGHLEHCGVCAEDVADLMEIRLQPRPARLWLRPVAAIVTLAAGIALIVRFSPAPSSPTPDAPAATSGIAAPAQAPELSSVGSALTSSEGSVVNRVLRSGRLDLPGNTSLLRGRVGTLLGPSGAAARFAPQAPLGTFVLETRPRFQWSALPDASNYVVAVFDEEFRQVAASGPVVGTSWIPEGDLPRDRVLTWQVTATTPAGTILSPAPPQPEARVVVLNTAAAAAITDQRARLRDEPLALGILLARAGLFTEAEHALARALEGRAAAQARALLADLRQRLVSLDSTARFGR